MTENYSYGELREAVGILLDHIDKGLPVGTHFGGNSPDWYVAAAMISSNVPEREDGEAIECLKELEKLSPYGPPEIKPLVRVEVL